LLWACAEAHDLLVFCVCLLAGLLSFLLGLLVLESLQQWSMAAPVHVEEQLAGSLSAALLKHDCKVHRRQGACTLGSGSCIASGT
jgi:hypothetical protein